MKIFKLLAGCLVATVTILSCKKQDDSISKELNAADHDFILAAAISNFSEIETAKVAISKTSDSVVLAFAQYLLTEHTQAHNDLKTMGSFVGFTVKDTIDTAHAAIINQLDTLTGRTFDSTYVLTQQADHQTTINFYRDEINNGLQENLKHYANTYLQNFVLDKQRADSIATTFH